MWRNSNVTCTCRGLHHARLLHARKLARPAASVCASRPSDRGNGRHRGRSAFARFHTYKHARTRWWIDDEAISSSSHIARSSSRTERGTKIMTRILTHTATAPWGTTNRSYPVLQKPRTQADVDDACTNDQLNVGVGIGNAAAQLGSRECAPVWSCTAAKMPTPTSDRRYGRAEQRRPSTGCMSTKRRVARADARKTAKVYGTRYSQAVTHPSTNRARRCLTSVIGREPVLST